jgi:hypothetical protein
MKHYGLYGLYGLQDIQDDDEFRFRGWSTKEPFPLNGFCRWFSNTYVNIRLVFPWGKGRKDNKAETYERIWQRTSKFELIIAIHELHLHTGSLQLHSADLASFGPEHACRHSQQKLNISN